MPHKIEKSDSPEANFWTRFVARCRPREKFFDATFFHMLNSRLLLKIALPMTALSLLLLTVGITAAWHVQKQQSESSDLITREVHGLIAAEDLFTTMREIRRELDLLLRTHARKHLDNVDAFLIDARHHIDAARAAARTEEESKIVSIIDDGFAHFLVEYEKLRTLPKSNATDTQYARLCDEILTDEILVPARSCIDFNTHVVDRTMEVANVNAKHMRVGFLLLGVTGGAAGLLIGLSLARAVSRSIVQLDVSVRSVAGKLIEVGGPSGGAVRISHYSNVQSLNVGFSHIEREITQVVELLHRKETELLRSEQLAVVGQLAAGMAHELRNPLMPIKVLVQSTLARPGEVSLPRRQLQIVDEELTRLEQSIQAFLDFARPPELVMNRLDVGAMLFQAVDLVYPKAHQQEVELHCVLPRGDFFINGDRTQLKQLLLNLLLNSIDALSEGGLVHIVLEPPEPPAERPSRASSVDSEQDALRVASDAVRDDSHLTIRIYDSGPGFPEELIPKIFEPFVTTKDTGTGLGLTICRQIVQGHHGTITARNRRPHGAEFCIRLPYSPHAAAPAERALATTSTT
ncbi:MAG: hypothetical protein C0483_25180 [Pirellula sp.]|nr:hypothetical protein [Pirellula sp.]